MSSGQGLLLYSEGKYSDALTAFQADVERNPSSSISYCNLAAARFKLELNRACIKDCEKASQLQPTNLRAYILKGKALLAMGKKKKAVAAWQEGLKLLSGTSAPQEAPDVILVTEIQELLRAHATNASSKGKTAPPAKEPQSATTEADGPKADTLEGEPSTVAESATANNTNNKKTQKKKRQAAKKKNKADGPHVYRTTSPALLKFVTESVVTAESFRQKKQLRQAVNVWEQVLAVQPGTNVVCHCYEQMGLAASANKQWAKAQQFFAKSAAEATTLPGGASGEAQAYSLLKQADACLGDATTSAAAGCVAESIIQGGTFGGDPASEAKARRARLRAGQPLVSANIGLPVGSDPDTYAPEEAIQLLKAAVHVADQTANYTQVGSVTSLAAVLKAGGPQFSKLLGSAEDQQMLNTPRASPEDLKVALARACVLCGEEDAGITLAQGVLERHEEHRGALLQYGLLADRRLKHADALSVLLRLLVKDTEDARVKLAFTDVLAQPAIDGVSTLKEELKLGEHAAPAYAFLATVVRDCGALQQSAELYEQAIVADPDNHNYCLNYVHVLENMAAYQKAFDVMKKFFSERGDFAVGNGLKCKEVMALIGHIDKLGDHCVVSSSPVIGIDGSDAATSDATVKHLGAGWQMKWVEAEKDPEDKSKTDPFILSTPPQGSEADVEFAEQFADASALKSTSDHDMLALYFTLVKVLYSTGCLLAIPPLVRCIEPARKGRDLGQTLIRNEHAYYVCISQLLCLHPMMQPTDAASADADTDADADAGAARATGPAAGDAAPPGALGASYFDGVGRSIYVCGDSHSLCPSWRVIRSAKEGGGDERCLLRSALVTGLKHWHLRPESRFYPKANFYRVVKHIPDGSDVILLFGEIDCREGILLAVEKGRYQSLEEGITVCVKIFITAMDDLHRRKGFNMYVHPIVPVLNETRYIVKTYNRILRKHVDRASHLTWLDFFPQLLTDDGEKLRRNYALDGTHMNPDYLPVLEKALCAVQKAAAESGAAS